MAVPSFLSTEFGHSELISVVDVQDIIDQLVIDLTGLTNPWSHSAGLFTSPLDSGGNQISFQLVRVSATRLSIEPTDRHGRNMFGAASTTRTMDIVASGDRVQLFFGENYVWVETLNPGTVLAEAEHFAVGILDLFPEDQAIHTQGYFARARRDSAGTLDTFGDQWGDFFCLDGNQTTYTVASRPLGLRDSGGSELARQRISGRLVHIPNDVTAKTNDGTLRLLGRQYQAFQVHGQLEPWSTVQIPIDDNPLTFGSFMVSNCREQSSAASVYRIALRTA